MRNPGLSPVRIMAIVGLALSLIVIMPGQAPALDDKPVFHAISGRSASGQDRLSGPLTAGVDYIPRLTTPLSDLALGWRQGVAEGRAQALANNLTLEDDRVMVEIRAQDTASADALIQALEQAGGAVSSRFQQWVEALVPAGALEDLAGREGVVYIRQPVPLAPSGPLPSAPASAEADSPQAGSYLTQGVAASNASAWHTAGITGTGVKVAILDVGFKNYTTARTLGELPSGLATYGTIDTTEEHGTACAEVVHDMAPGADLTICNVTSSIGFASRIMSLAAAGNKIISTSIGSWGGDPGDGSGSGAQAIDLAYNSYGTLTVKSAGNYARTHYDGTWRDTDGDGWHEFSDSAATEINSIGTVPANYIMDLRLRWNDWPTSNNDYDLYLYYKSGSSWIQIASSVAIQDGTQPPFERIYGSVNATLEFGVKIRKKGDGTSSNVLSLMNMGYGDISLNQPRRSLNDEAAAQWAYAVAALDVNSPYPRENYSSWGPAYGSGGVISGGNNQPQLSGFANVNTYAYSSEAPSYYFNGTSAATPHVAGAAALVWSAYPGYSALQVRQFLDGRAIDMGTGAYAGYDTVYGWGRLWLGDPPTSPPIGGCPVGPLNILLQ